MKPNEINPAPANPWPLIGAGMALAAFLFMGYVALRPTSESTEGGAPVDETEPKQTGAKSKSEKDKPKIISCFVTRRGEVPYQRVIRYNKVAVPFASMPGAAEVAEALQLKGKRISPMVFRVDQETESVIDNLGLETRSQVSYKAYLDWYDGQVIAYDIASTSGGIPQRLLGRLSKKGVKVDILRGGRKVDLNEVTFPHDTSILPIEMEFVHDWYQVHSDYKKPVQWLFFVPEVFGFIRLIVYPPTLEHLPHRGSVHQCAKYEVVVTSTKAQEGVFSRQQMWFDMKTRALLRRVDLEPGNKASDEVMAERIDPKDIQELQPQIVRAPKMKLKKFPYILDRTLTYFVTSREKDLGFIRVRFSRQEKDASGPAGYLAHAEVELETGGSFRKETATTRYDEHFLPIQYVAKGEEAADQKADYEVDTRFKNGQVTLQMKRKVNPLKAETGAGAVDPEELGPPLGFGAGEGPKPDQEKKPLPEGKWEPPLRHVALEDGQEDSPKPRFQDRTFQRPLSEGTFVYDFNRVEHLAAAVFSFPLPSGAVPVKGRPPEAFQRLGLFLVRQNKAGVLFFTIRPEPTRVPEEDEWEDGSSGQGKGADPGSSQPERLFMVNATGALLPCTMLLDSRGRLVQLTTRFGSGEVTYTLDDPIMRMRQERARKRRGQEGPVLLKPPWY